MALCFWLVGERGFNALMGYNDISFTQTYYNLGPMLLSTIKRNESRPPLVPNLFLPSTVDGFVTVCMALITTGLLCFNFGWRWVLGCQTSDPTVPVYITPVPVLTADCH